MRASLSFCAALGALLLASACGSSASSPAGTKASTDGWLETVSDPNCPIADHLPLGVSFTQSTDVRGIDAHCSATALSMLTRRAVGATYESSAQTVSRTYPRSIERVYAVDAASGNVSYVDLGGDRPSFVRLNAAAEEVSRIHVDLPRIRSMSLDGLKSFNEVCWSRRELVTLTDYGGLKLELVLLARDRAALVVESCGYVDVLQFSTKNQSIEAMGTVDVTTLVQVDPDVIVPLTTFVDMSDGEATVVTSTGAPGQPRSIAYWRSATAGAPQRFTLPSKDDAPFSFRDCGKFALLVGDHEKADALGPNDSTSDDAWVAKVDLGTGQLVTTRNFDVSKDDFAFSAACDRESGDVWVGGTTARHFVDTGSWDGGGKVLLMRLDANLDEQERLVFGTNRTNIARRIMLGKDRMIVTGTWDGMPNNHFPAVEDWSRAFIAVLPRVGFGSLAVEPRAFQAIGEVVTAPLQ